MVLGIGFLLLVSLALSAAVATVGSVFKAMLPGMQVLAHIADLAVSFAVVMALFALMYKFLPDVKMLLA